MEKDYKVELPENVYIKKEWVMRPLQVTCIVNTPEKQTPRPLVRRRTISTERPPLVGETSVPTFADRGVSRGQRGCFFFREAPHLSSRG
jgi:hypothetical protein